MAHARFHHYHFSHRALPEAFFEDPDTLIRLLGLPLGSQWLSRLWQGSGEKIITPDKGPRLGPEGLATSACQVGDRRCVMLTMPKPEGVVEVYYALLIIDETPEGKEPRYFVLERTEQATNDAPAGFVCEWLADGSRRNHGVHIRAGERAFCDAVAELLRREAVRRESGVRRSEAYVQISFLGGRGPKTRKEP